MDASPIVTDTPRQLGTCRDYDGLHRILRDRAEELNVSRCTLDTISGLTWGHSSKLLSPKPLKKLGAVSLGLMLQSLGLKLVVVEDAESLRRISAKLVPREIPVAIQAVNVGRGKRRLVSLRHLRKIASAGGRARMEKLTPKQRSAHARAAVMARWARKAAWKTACYWLARGMVDAT
jgi:hypothetical protein